MAVAQGKRGVRTTHPDYDRMLPIWQKCRAVIAGQKAMHAAAAAYIPRLIDEPEESYRARLARSDFFNGSWITVRAFVGMLFRKPPAKDIPTGLDEIVADVTMTGKEAETFAKALAHEALSITRYGILIDHPSAPEGVTPITVAAARAMRLRPKAALYTAESITNWRPAEAGSDSQYAMVTLREEHPIPEDEFSHKCETRYRVLDLDPTGHYRQRLFRINDKSEDEQIGGDIYPLMAGQKLPYVPFKTYGADGEEVEVDEPALIDLFDANVAVYQINSDYRHGLHFTALPTPVVSGYIPENKAEKLYIGSTSAWVFPDPNAKASFLEFTGQGLSELREAIREKKQEMAMAGARAIMDETKQVETLGGTQIKRNGENSALANVAITVSASIEWALTVMSEWSGQAAEIVYQLNRIFLPAMMDAQTLGSLIAANQAGKLSDEELFDLMQRGDVIDSEIKFEEHQAVVEITAPSPARPGVKPNQDDPEAAAA